MRFPDPGPLELLIIAVIAVLLFRGDFRRRIELSRMWRGDLKTWQKILLLERHLKEEDRVARQKVWRRWASHAERYLFPVAVLVAVAVALYLAF
jgi:hypothetical protein